MSIKSNKSLFKAKHTSVVTILVTIIATSLFTLGLPHAAKAQTARDSTVISTLVRNYENVFNTCDAAALTAFFTSDADMIMGNQPILRDREAIQNWWQKYFTKREKGLMSSFIITSFRFVTGDAALVNVAYTSNGRNARDQQLPVRKARGTWVVVRRAGHWLIAAVRGMPTEDDRIIRAGSH